MSARSRSLPVVVDCLDRHAVCGAGCCTFDVPLTDEEVGSGRYQLAEDSPFAQEAPRKFLARAAHGLCVYWTAQPEACSIYATRPAACRAFSCHGDGRVWRDFDARVINRKAMAALRGRGTAPPR